jgi:uncharacterized metal-binding protein YceD (DUF177 family)
MNGDAILSRPVEVAGIPPEGLVMDLDASPQQRAALAEALGLLEVRGVSAQVTLRALAKGALLVEGRIEADIVQTCVVSLVPVDQHIDESFTLRFVAPGAVGTANADTAAPAHGEPEPPEVLAGPTIDVGALAEEHFVLAIDPYPRAPGAELPPEATEPRDASADSPFAALATFAGRQPPKG